MTSDKKGAAIGQVDLKKAQQPGVQRGRDTKLQQLGRQTISTLYMLVRNVKMYDPDNDIFVQPFENLRTAINTIVAVDGLYQLQACGTTVYVNNKQLQLDFASLDNVRFLTEEFKARDVGGFNVARPVQLQELKDFIWIFSPRNEASVEEDGVQGKKLLNIKVGKFAKIHLHTDDEVRYILAGRGYFGFVEPDDGQFLVEVAAGDYINVPANTEHWFEMRDSGRIKAVRYFIDTSGWTPVYTGRVREFAETAATA